MDLQSYIERLSRQDKLLENEVKTLCDTILDIYSTEKNIINLTTPLTVAGDIHGQLPDLLELFSVAGDLPWTTFLFLGDYVDRGYHSVESYLLLLCLKALYPQRITLIRGNHESEEITQVYGFYDECLHKYGNILVWKYCLNTFNALPIAALIDNKVICVHGGLSPDLTKVDQMYKIERKMDVPHEGLFCDLLWSDPDDQQKKGWNISPRGAGYLFGPDVVDKFRHDNSLEYIIRAHQLVLEGYKWHFKNTVLTVWSAPNYCYRCGNVASVLELTESRGTNFIIFDAAPESCRTPINNPHPPEYFI
ncbi:uncharacterized protein [Halyomorpha halys]|uniref:uncharacterized protein n=1 Tax=Halyomorpha halys TaxID=286706 RepID=UPI0006D50213|nr:serine/threonine-protein phosphatase PP-X isozyme 2-like [Halyomorpha halys]